MVRSASRSIWREIDDIQGSVLDCRRRLLEIQRRLARLEAELELREGEPLPGAEGLTGGDTGEAEELVQTD